jgi:hypothetical protein
MVWHYGQNNSKKVKILGGTLVLSLLEIKLYMVKNTDLRFKNSTKWQF